MSYTILTESYGRRLPKITAEADSTDDLTTLGTDWAEGSTCEISTTTYKLDKVKGWVDPSSGGGGGGAEPLSVEITMTGTVGTMDATITEIAEALAAGTPVVISIPDGSDYFSQGYSVVSAVAYYDGDPTIVYFVMGSYVNEWQANADGYPEFDFNQ